MSDIAAYLVLEKELTKAEFKKYFEIKAKEKRSRTFRRVLQQIEHYALTGGKWARPTLARMSFGLVKSPTTKPLNLMLASSVLEATHRLILIHDDIADRDMLRHGEPTMEEFFNQLHYSTYGIKAPAYYGAGMAVVAGDVLNAYLNDMLTDSQLSGDTLHNVLKGLNSLWIDTCEGWFIEADQKKQPINSMTMEKISQAQELVSARYSFVWPLRIGQLLAGRKFGEWDKRLEAYGYNVGMAFQIQDDILALFGESEKTGKPTGNDIREGKKTVILYETYINASAADRKWLEMILGTEVTKKDMHKVRQLMTETGALKKSQERASNYVAKALKSLDSLPHNDVQQKLSYLAKYMIERHT